MGPEEKQVEIYQGASGEAVFDVDAEGVDAIDTAGSATSVYEQFHECYYNVF